MTKLTNEKPLDIHDLILAYAAQADSQTADLMQNSAVKPERSKSHPSSK